MVHDTSRGGQNDKTELTSRQELHDPLLEVAELDVVARVDDAALVEAAKKDHQHPHLQALTKVKYVPAVQLDNNLAGAVVINLLKLADVA